MKNNKDIVIGIDIGTGGVKAELFDSNGKSLAFSFRKSRLIKPTPETVEEDPEFQVSNLCAAVSECMKNSRRHPSDVTAVGIDGQMAGIIGIGRDGRCVTPYDSWLDTRCGKYILQMEERAGNVILAKTGCAPSFNHGPKILWWKSERPDVFKKICSFVQPGAYAAMRLCGLKSADAFIDRTYLHFSGFADNPASKWNGGLCDEFKINREVLPKIVSPETIVGELTSSMAKRCGLCAGIPVIAGCGDTAASFLSCGAVSEGTCVDVAGTASVFSAAAGTFKADTGRRILACGQAAIPGLWHSYAYINGGGMNLNWFAERIAGIKMTGVEKEADFKNLNRLAAKIKSDGNLPLFIPHLGGRVCPIQPNMRGAWINLSWSHGTAHLYRAILESVALEYRIYVDTIRSLYPGIALTELRITGGGEKSDLWNQMKADVLGIPVSRIANGHGAPLGAAILAAWGAGMVKCPAEAALKWIKLSKTYEPDLRKSDYYEHRSKQYKEALELLKEQ